MREQFACPRTQEVCNNAELCGEVNATLVNVIPHIRQQVGGTSARFAKSRLRHEIGVQADLLAIDLYTEFDDDSGDARVCPDDLSKDRQSKSGRSLAAFGLAGILDNCVQNVITEIKGINSRQTRY